VVEVPKIDHAEMLISFCRSRAFETDLIAGRPWDNHHLVIAVKRQSHDGD